MNEAEPVSIATSEVFLLHEIVTALDRVARLSYLNRHGLSFTEFLVMMMVDQLGNPSQTEVGRMLDFSNSSVSQKVSSLREKGIVRQERDPKSRRTVRLSLTEAGRAKLEVVYPELDAAAERIFVQLGEKRADFHAALLVLRDAQRESPEVKQLGLP